MASSQRAFRRASSTMAVLLFGPVFGGVLPASGQSESNGIPPAVQVPVALGCKQCRLVVHAPSVVVASDATIAFADMPSGLFRHPAGSFLVTQGNTGGVPLLFSSNGKAIREIGTMGSGPGEYTGAMRIAFGPGDSSAIVDNRLRRVSVLDRDWRYVRSFRIDGQPSDLAWLPNGDFVVGGPIATASQIGYPLHVLRADGTPKASLGYGNKAIVSHATAEGSRLVQAAGPSDFYAMTVIERLELERWSGTRLQKRWVLGSPYLPDRTALAEKRPFQAILSSFWVGPEEILYLLMVVPRKTWREGVKSSRTADGEELFEIVDQDKIFETVIEIVDLKAGRVLVRSPTERAFFGLLAGGSAYRLDKTDDTGPRFEVSRIRLVR